MAIKPAGPQAALDVPHSLAKSFASELVRWQKSHGRHHLPWQNTRDPYRVWLSEIMLQQTQVSTVLDYFTRFTGRFPDVASLANAHQDEVLGLWSGLGYYSRARNLHQCAQQVVQHHGGTFPTTAAELASLPGIGPSTAAAVAAFCYGERVAILDGNVKRVLTRVLGFGGDLAEGAQVKLLWDCATQLLPDSYLDTAMPRYTQGLMDLGATVCVRRNPHCGVCPVQDACSAFEQSQPEKYPVKTRKLKRGSEQIYLLWAQQADGSVWLERRPVKGIWGGLYCLPVFDTEDALRAALPAAVQAQVEVLAAFKHVITHKDLHITPVRVAWGSSESVRAAAVTLQALPEADHIGAWFSPELWAALGLPAPIRSLLSGKSGQAAAQSLALNF